MVHGSCLFTNIYNMGEETGATHHGLLKDNLAIDSEVQNTSLFFFAGNAARACAPEASDLVLSLRRAFDTPY